MSAAVHSFIQGFLFSLSLCFDLGIVNAAIMKTGIERGVKPSFAIGFGSCFGDLFYLTLALIGVGVVFEITWVKWVLWIVGTFYLCYLTVKMLLETRSPKALSAHSSAAPQRTYSKDFWAGAGLAMASPSVIAWFALVAGPIVAGMHLQSSFELACFVLGFFAAGLLWSLAVAVVSSMTGAVFQGTMTRLLSFGSALLFLYFAIRVFWMGLRELV